MRHGAASQVELWFSLVGTYGALPIQRLSNGRVYWRAGNRVQALDLTHTGLQHSSKHKGQQTSCTMKSRCCFRCTLALMEVTNDVEHSPAVACRLPGSKWCLTTRWACIYTDACTRVINVFSAVRVVFLTHVDLQHSIS